MRTIRVGLDGSRASGHALHWAAGAARDVGAAVEVASVYGIQGQVFRTRHGIPDDRDPEEVVHQRQRDVVDEHAGDTSGLTLRHSVMLGHPAERLCNAEPAPDLLVLGTRGVGGFVGLLVGSTAHQAIEHAPCPTVVVPDGEEPPRAPRQVVVGVDGSRAGEQALVWAGRWAAELDSEVEVVVAWQGSDGSAPANVQPTSVATSAEAASRLAERVRANAEERLSGAGVVTTSTVERGRPHDVLLARAAEADLLVLGAPGEEHALHLGSVAHRCLKSAPVPVVVVRS